MTENNEIKCPLCGYRFNSQDNAKCHLCADKGKCSLICCPNCGYSFPERAYRTDTGKSWLSRLRRKSKS